MYVISEEWCQCCHCLVPDVVASVGQNLTTAKTFQVLRTTSAVWVLRQRCAQPTPLDRGQVLTLYSGMQYVKSLHHHEQIILQCLYTNTHINLLFSCCCCTELCLHFKWINFCSFLDIHWNSVGIVFQRILSTYLK